MSTMHLMIGNIGTGKSLIARKLMLGGAAVVNMDTIQAMFAAGDYGRYDTAKKDAYHATENAALESCLALGLDVVIDRTNMDRKRRARFIELGSRYDAHIIAYDFGAGYEIDLHRRFDNPRGQTHKTWSRVFDYMKGVYEEPSLDEGFHEIIEPPDHYRFHAFDFDGVLCENRFPEIGDPIGANVQTLKALFEDLSNIIIIWSCRDENYAAKMRKWLIDCAIPFDFINENPLFLPGSRKIFAHQYYDDRNASVASATTLAV